MNDLEIKYLGDVQRLVLRPDDVVVLSVKEHITDATAERIKALVQKVLGEDRKVLVLGSGLTLEVLGKKETLA